MMAITEIESYQVAFPPSPLCKQIHIYLTPFSLSPVSIPFPLFLFFIMYVFQLYFASSGLGNNENVLAHYYTVT